MKVLLLLVMALVLSSCASQESRLSDIFDRLEFKENQEGCISFRGQISVGGNPFAQSSIYVNMVKTQGDVEDDC